MSIEMEIFVKFCIEKRKENKEKRKRKEGSGPFDQDMSITSKREALPWTEVDETFCVSSPPPGVALQQCRPRAGPPRTSKNPGR